MLMPKEIPDSTLISSGFDAGLDGWAVYNAGTLSNDNGRLKFSGSQVWSSLKKDLQLKMGKQYRVRFTIDMGNCKDLHVPVYKSDITSYEVISGIGISITASGTYEGTFMATSNSMLLIFEMIPGVNPPPDSTGYYWIDDVTVEEIKEGGGGDGPSANNGAYRYGFNGKEKDNSISSLTDYDYGFRIYNPALGKFLSVDPLTNKYPWLTPFQFASNNPIKLIDIDGLEGGDPAFKNFDPKAVSQSADDRVSDPSKIDQNGTGLCGPAAIAFLMASKQPERYKRVVNELLQYGSSTLGNQNYDPLTNTGENNAYTIRADGNAFGGNDLLDVDPKGKDYPNNGGIKMNQADFILLSSIKNSKNDFMNYNGKKDSWVDQYAGITMPSGIASLMTDMLGATDVENKTNLLMSGGGIDALKKIQSDFATGKSVLMFVNSGMIDGSNGTSSITANHWIVYQGELKIDETQKTVQFKAYSWGGLQTFSMSIETFHDNFYGTVSGTVPAKPDK